MGCCNPTVRSPGFSRSGPPEGGTTSCPRRPPEGGTTNWCTKGGTTNVLATILLAIACCTVSAAEPVRLTHDGKLKFAPVFVDAEHVVFAVHETPRQVVLKRLDLATGQEERLHPNVAAHQFDPAFSRDG